MIDRDRLVELALRLVSTPSFTGSEEAAADLMRSELASLGLQVQWQQVEDGRANVLGTLAGVVGGPSLMFNGHMDTSYSGREPWLRHVPGFQPSGFERLLRDLEAPRSGQPSIHEHPDLPGAHSLQSQGRRSGDRHF